MKREFRLLRVEFQRAIRSGRMPCMVILVAILGTVSSLGSIVKDVRIGFAKYSLVWYFEDFFYLNNWFVPLFYSIASYVAVSYFCQEWRTGYWKSLELRSGKRVYLYGKSINGFLLGFCTVFLGLLLYVLILAGIGVIVGYPLYDPMQDGEGIQPVVYILLWIVTFSTSAGFWSLIGLLMAAIQNDSFIAVTMPLALNLTIDYVLRKATGGTFSTSGFACLSVMPDRYVITGIRGILVFILLGAVCGWIVTRFLRKRVENEWYS